MKNRLNLEVEELEARYLLSTTLDVFRVEETLRIDGSAQRDEINVEMVGNDRIRVVFKSEGDLDRLSRTFTGIDLIVFHGRSGDDAFVNENKYDSIQDVPNAPRARLNGGPGDDRLDGGPKQDTIIGGDDGDTIYAGNGNDEVKGGDAKDTIHGGDGDDIIFGNAGNDVIYGNDGNDRLFGGKDADTLRGGNHNDFLDDGSRSVNERMIPGQGVDFDADRPSLDGAEASDIYQGRANSCHLGASISAVAHSQTAELVAKNRLRYLGVDPSTAEGIYRVKLYKDGWNWYEVRFAGSWKRSEFKPVMESGDTLAESWTILYQRAYEERGFVSPNGDGAGFPDEALQALTGNSTVKRKFDLKLLRSLSQLDRAIVAAVSTKTKNLVSRHAYTVLSVGKGTDPMITVRNPWGGSAPKEFPSTPVGTGNEKDGVFQVSWKEFQKGVSELDFAH